MVVKEMKLTNASLQKRVDTMKKGLEELGFTNDLKLVGITFTFLDEEEDMTAENSLYSKGFNKDDYGK